MDLSSLSLAYFAGLFDGEGHVKIQCKRDGSISFGLVVSNQHEGVLEMLRAEFGGAVTRKSKPHPRLPVFDWQIGADNAERFARAILPFTLIKTAQLEFWLESRERLCAGPGRRSPITEDEAYARRECSDRLKRMRGSHLRGAAA